ncbi:ATP-dependent RNA helicase DeaD [Abditibacterium utsteinense]|uniref:DEAD-box ATP-dependent RNA helicase RhpA n=1 Tax=Abditibacterium utsteinense TaxID=1960156 RepID=A0A2S8SR81_9BACT|nr:DEAD/DEAH box helicase [Abditibacterium utsteinense]PQV63321.1 ATP-dependent RNA helicase DeaD [Abditibacterium utsteinense]
MPKTKRKARAAALELQLAQGAQNTPNDAAPNDAAPNDAAPNDAAQSSAAQSNTAAIDADNKPKRPKKIAVPETSPEEASEEIAELPAFSQLDLSEPVARAIREMGFETPTPIQARAVPLLMAGHDLIGQAQTGTGKTAAFALPLIHKIDASNPHTQALVLAPTRELAVQVAEGIYELAKHTNLRVVPIYGGQPIDRQFRALRAGAPIVVGTPGRVLDHLRRGSLSLEHVTFCTLDEADEMLALGFLEEIEQVLGLLPEQRQLAFFSATMPPRILTLMKKFLRDPKTVVIESKQRTLDTTNQAYYEVLPGQKFEALVKILDMETPGPTIIFCRTRRETSDVAEGLQVRGYGAEALHGEMNQSERERVLRRFKDDQCDLLVATDVAARGLDIDTVTHVINFDIPFDVEQYIHRIGRTGRAGRSGDAITLVQGRERRQLRLIENMIGAQIKPVRLPTQADIAARQRDLFHDSLRTALEAREFEGHLSTVDALSAQFEPTEIAAAAIAMLWEQQHPRTDHSEPEIEADGQQPERGMTRIFVGLGRQDGLRPGDLVGAIANETGISGRDIGAIDIGDNGAFVDVPAPATQLVIDALRRTKLRGKRPEVQIARPFDGR